MIHDTARHNARQAGRGYACTCCDFGALAVIVGQIWTDIDMLAANNGVVTTSCVAKCKQARLNPQPHNHLDEELTE